MKKFNAMLIAASLLVVACTKDDDKVEDPHHDHDHISLEILT